MSPKADGAESEPELNPESESESESESKPKSESESKPKSESECEEVGICEQELNHTKSHCYTLRNSVKSPERLMKICSGQAGGSDVTDLTMISELHELS